MFTSSSGTVAGASCLHYVFAHIQELGGLEARVSGANHVGKCCYGSPGGGLEGRDPYQLINQEKGLWDVRT